MDWRRHEGHKEVQEGHPWAFGYAFIELNDDQKHERRLFLNWYPVVAELSILVVLALFQVCFFVQWLAKRGLDYERPKSPSFNKPLRGRRTWLQRIQQSWQRASWWMSKEVIWDWGTRGQWIGAGVWTLWLLCLCFVNTGNDYLHLTKRFGIVGASQLPFHYLLALRSPYSPLQYLTRTSHEQLKPWHQVLGRIVFFFFALHAAFYMNFFVLSGFLAKRIKDRDVILGIVSIVLFSTISTTALGAIRRWNYRVFYFSHIMIANLIWIPLFLHVVYIRPYIIQVVLVIGLHAVFRSLRLNVYDGTIKLLPGTNLVEVRTPLTTTYAESDWKPGQHVYLSPPAGRPHEPFANRLLRGRDSNPFTVASIPSKDEELLLVARALNGQTKKTADLARSWKSDEAPTIPIALEGPYGASKHLPDFTAFDNVLFVAGGIGATFTMPLYRSIVESIDPDPTQQIRFVWAVQKLSETQWAFDTETTTSVEDATAQPHSSRAVEVFVTRPSGAHLQADSTVDVDEGIELAEDDQLLSMEEQMEKPRKGMILKSGRPKIDAIVDETFHKGSRVAVITCGPKKMTTTLRRSVERWVEKGYEVFWHDEAFGW